MRTGRTRCAPDAYQMRTKCIMCVPEEYFAYQMSTRCLLCVQDNCCAYQMRSRCVPYAYRMRTMRTMRMMRTGWLTCPETSPRPKDWCATACIRLLFLAKSQRTRPDRIVRSGVQCQPDLLHLSQTEWYQYPQPEPGTAFRGWTRLE